MDNTGVFIFWSILIIAALILDVLAYFVIRYYWNKYGGMLTSELRAQIFNRLGEVFKTSREKLPVIGKPDQAQPDPVSLPSEPFVQTIPASVTMVGQLRQVEFSMEMPLNSAIDVHIGASSEDGVKMEQREL